MSCFKGRMREYTSVSLDRFDGRNLSSTLFFLSHCHQDHMAGLDSPTLHDRLKSRTDLYLYCSDLTKTLLLADNRYTYLEKFIKTLEVNVPTMVTIPDQEGDNKKSGTVLVTGLSAGHCPGSLMFLFEGKEGTVLYTGDFRWETNYAQNLQALKTGDSVKDIKSLYIDTTFCFEDAFHFPSRNECVEAAADLVSKWLNHSKNHVVSLSCKAKYGYEHFLQELNNRTGEKIHTSQDKCNIYQQIGELKDVFMSDPTARIHVCNFKTDRSPLSKLPCGYVPSDGAEQQVLVLRPSTMFFALQRPHSRPTDLIVYPKGSRGLHRVCYSFHSSYVEVRDLVMFLKPDRVFPNVKPPNESDMTKVQARLNGFLKMVHLSEVPSLLAPSRVLGQLKIRRSIYADSSQSDSEGLVFGTPEKKKSVVPRPTIIPSKTELTPSETSIADSSYQGSVERNDEEELDLFGSQESGEREHLEKMDDHLGAGDSAESYCLYVSGDEDCEEEDRVGTQTFPDLDDVIVIESQDSPSDTAAEGKPPLDTTAGGKPPLDTAAEGKPPLETTALGKPSLDTTAAELPDRVPVGEPVIERASSKSVRDSEESLDTEVKTPPDRELDTKKSANDKEGCNDDLLLDSEDDLLGAGTEEAVSSSGRDAETLLKDKDGWSRSEGDDILLDSDNEALDTVTGEPSDKQLLEEHFLPTGRSNTADKSVKDKETYKGEEILVDSDDDLLDTGEDEDGSALGKVTVELVNDEECQSKCSEVVVQKNEENSINGNGSQDDIKITGEEVTKLKNSTSALVGRDVKANSVSVSKSGRVNIDTCRSDASPEGGLGRIITITDNQGQSGDISAGNPKSDNSASVEKSGPKDKTAKSSISKNQSVSETKTSCTNSLDFAGNDNNSASAQKLKNIADGAKSSLQPERTFKSKLPKTSSFDLFDEGHVTDIEDNVTEDITETQGFDVEVLETESRSRRRKYITEIDQNEENTLRKATAQMLLRLQTGAQSSSLCPRTLSRPVDSGEQIVISSSESDTESGFLSGGKEGGRPPQGSIMGREYAKNLGALVSKMEKRLASSDGEYSPSKRIRLDISRNCESDSDVTLPPSQGSYGSRLQPCLFFDSDSVSESDSEMDTDSDAVEILYETDASGAKYDVLGNLMRPETTLVRMQTQFVGQTLEAGESHFIDLTEDGEEETEGGRDSEKDKCSDECPDGSDGESNDVSRKAVAKESCKGSTDIKVADKSGAEGQKEEVKDKDEKVEDKDEKVKGKDETVKDKDEKVKDLGEDSGVVGQRQDDVVGTSGDVREDSGENKEKSETAVVDEKKKDDGEMEVTAVEESKDSN